MITLGFILKDQIKLSKTTNKSNIQVYLFVSPDQIYTVIFLLFQFLLLISCLILLKLEVKDIES